MIFLKPHQVLLIPAINFRKNYSIKLIKRSNSRSRDEQGEHFAFVVLDTTGTLFRFGYCRRSNREATCLCIIRWENFIELSIFIKSYCFFFFSLYPWFEVFYTILNDLAQIINSKAVRIVLIFY